MLQFKKLQICTNIYTSSTMYKHDADLVKCFTGLISGLLLKGSLSKDLASISYMEEQAGLGAPDITFGFIHQLLIVTLMKTRKAFS